MSMSTDPNGASRWPRRMLIGCLIVVALSTGFLPFLQGCGTELSLSVILLAWYIIEYADEKFGGLLSSTRNYKPSSVLSCRASSVFHHSSACSNGCFVGAISLAVVLSRMPAGPISGHRLPVAVTRVIISTTVHTRYDPGARPSSFALRDAACGAPRDEGSARGPHILRWSSC